MLLTQVQAEGSPDQEVHRRVDREGVHGQEEGPQGRLHLCCIGWYVCKLVWSGASRAIKFLMNTEQIYKVLYTLYINLKILTM